MAGTLPQDVADLILDTFEDFQKNKWTDLAQTEPAYFSNWFFSKNKHRIQSGDRFRFDIMKDYGTDNAGFVGMEDQLNPKIDDVMKAGYVDHTIQREETGISDVEVKANSEPRRIINLALTRKAAMYGRFMRKRENALFNSRISSSPPSFFGLFYWIVYNATEGFTGAAATGFTTVGDITLTEVPNYKSYNTGTYTAISEKDGVKKLRTALLKTNFESSLPVEMQGGKGYEIQPSNRVIICGATPKLELGDVARARNMNPGFVIGTEDGRMNINGIPVRYASKLDSAPTAAPVIGIDSGSLYPVCLQDLDMELSMKDGALQIGMDMWILRSVINTCCDDRRKQFMMAKADPMTELG